jgi:hypothetical protein
MDPDLGGQKTCGSGGSESVTLAGTLDEEATRKQKLETRRQILHATGSHSGTI